MADEFKKSNPFPSDFRGPWESIAGFEHETGIRVTYREGIPVVLLEIPPIPAPGLQLVLSKEMVEELLFQLIEMHPGS